MQKNVIMDDALFFFHLDSRGSHTLKNTFEYLFVFSCLSEGESFPMNSYVLMINFSRMFQLLNNTLINFTGWYISK
jgi:hypothetical protein